MLKTVQKIHFDNNKKSIHEMEINYKQKEEINKMK